MKRREFITLLGGAAAWPLAARAQQPDRIRLIGVLVFSGEDDVEAKAWISSFVRGLRELNWIEGGNVHIDRRWAAVDPERARMLAGELVALKPDVILASNTTTLTALHQATHTTPIVFANVSDPVGGGFVQTFTRPGGNVTGFVPAEASPA